MELSGDRQLLSDLLRTNQELVTVNRAIAETLANLEQLYAEEVQRNEEQRQKNEERMARITNPFSQWKAFVPIIVIVAVAGLLPLILRLLK